MNLVTPWDSCTPTQSAADAEKVDWIRLLLELGADINGPRGGYGSTLHYVLRSKDASAVKYMLANGAEVDDTCPGQSLLCKAVEFGLDDLIPLLLAKGVDVAKTEHSWTALGKAFYKGNRGTVQLLLDHGATYFDVGADCLLDTVLYKTLEDVKALLDNGGDPNLHRRNQTALGVATVEQQRDLVELLLDYGGDLNSRVGVGPLAIAVDDDDVELVEFLLERNADPNIFSEGYRYAIYNAAGRSNVHLLGLLLRHGAYVRVAGGGVFRQAIWGGEKVIMKLLEVDMTAAEREKLLDVSLQSAAREAKIDMCEFLLKQGANVNFSDGIHRSPLQAALYDYFNQPEQLNNRKLIIDLFIMRDARVNNPDPTSKLPSALALALEHHASKEAKTLLNAGADVNIVGGEYHSPLQAAAYGTPSMLETLLEHGADVNAIGGRFGTALHAAAYAHNTGSIRLLLKHGADVSIIAGKYGSILQATAKCNSGSWTAGRDSVRVMQVLFDHGASATVEDEKYGTALQSAARTGNFEGVKWLIEHGADPHVRGGKYGTALKAAKKRKGEKFVVIS